MLLLGALVAATALAPAPASPSPIDLTWHAPDSCPTAGQLVDWLGDALANSSARTDDIVVRGDVREGERQFVLDLALWRATEDGEQPLGQRTIEAADCEALSRAAVLIVALAIDPNATPREPEPTIPAAPPSHVVDEPDPTTEPTVAEPSTTPEPPPAEPSTTPEPPPAEPSTTPEPPPAEPSTTPEPPPAEPSSTLEPLQPTETETVPSPPSTTPLHFGARLGVGAGLSVLPEPTAALSLAATMWRGAWRVELGLHYWTPVRTALSTGQGGTIQQWTIDPRGCGVLRPGPLELPLCAGLDIGAVHGRGRGVAEPRRVQSLRLAFAAGPALVWRPARWNARVGFSVGAEVLAAIVRARFRPSPAAPALVYYTPPVGARAGIGVEVRFR